MSPLVGSRCDAERQKLVRGSVANASLQLTRSAPPLESATHPAPAPPAPAPESAAVSTTDHEASRAEKLARIESLGIDPWGQRFDGATPIAQIRAQPAESFDTNPTTRARAAGRIVLRRIMGKVHLLQLRDQTGDVQVMIRQKQVGDNGWQLAQNLDLARLVGAEGDYGHTCPGR